MQVLSIMRREEYEGRLKSKSFVVSVAPLTICYGWLTKNFLSQQGAPFLQKIIIMMTLHKINLLKNSWKIAAENPEVVGALFYGRLMEQMTEYKSLFRRTNIPEQSRKLISMLSYIISRLDNLDNSIIEEVGKLAQRHVQYGVKIEHYTIVGPALLWTLEQGLGNLWNDELRDTWTECYAILSVAMINASNYPQQTAA